ncbi:hypothetical protein [Caballeronia humi]|uniref:hypothetical protein n=1 Tax=Caballeronia humi TaxID=326474 RepID=UPI000AB7F93B|nr:hypothetical protein [Caballeronia humi]
MAHLHVRKLDVEDASTDFASIAERPQTMPMRGNGIASKVRLGASIPIACDPMCVVVALARLEEIKRAFRD